MILGIDLPHKKMTLSFQKLFNAISRNLQILCDVLLQIDFDQNNKSSLYAQILQATKEKKKIINRIFSRNLDGHQTKYVLQDKKYNIISCTTRVLLPIVILYNNIL